MTPLAALEFPFNGLADQVCPLLAILKHPVDPRQGSGRKPGWRLFLIDTFSTHAPIIKVISPIDKPTIDDIMYP